MPQYNDSSKGGMNMHILEGFLHSNIEPADYDASLYKEQKKLLQLISRNENKLLATMTDAQKKLFSRDTDSIR